MRFAAVLFCSATLAMGQNIATKVLTPGAPIRISLSPALTTTLLFPGPLSGTFGLGLITGNNANSGGSVQVEHPDGSNVLVLHALSETAHVLMTVLLDSRLYVFDLQSAAQADVAVTMVREGSAQDPGVAPKAQPVTTEEIVAARPKYDPELLVGLLRRARDAAILQPLYRDLYQGYAKRDAQYTSENDSVKTTVTAIHRFSKEDAVVLQCVVENKLDRPITFDGRSATILVANEVHPVKLLDCLRPIPAKTKTLCDAVIQGGVDGGRANLSIENEYRLELPPVNGEGTVWNFKNGGNGGRFKVPTPAPSSPIPLTQTQVKREGQ